jgi:H+/Cl- antiporter ClcA
VDHTSYTITEYPAFSASTFAWVAVAGVAFGVTALIFNYSKKGFTNLFRWVKYPPLRPFIGGIVLVLIVFFLGTTKYLGLGVPIIQSAFEERLMPYDFVIKLLLTAFTLGAGFKGGEATPLFFMGATLGSALIWFVPLPISFLAGLGFVAVFAGATNTPIACTIMGVELFDWQALPYLVIVCFVAYFISGRTSVYARQQEELRKISVLTRFNKRR